MGTASIGGVQGGFTGATAMGAAGAAGTAGAAMIGGPMGVGACCLWNSPLIGPS